MNQNKLRELKEVIARGIQTTDGSTRTVLCILSGYYKNKNPELSEFLQTILDETRESDFKKLLKERDEIIQNTISYLIED
jgi:hypothetical protein